MVYALKRVSSRIIRKESWDSFEAHICHVALTYPNTLQTVARLLSTYARVGYPLDLTRLSRLVNAAIEDHAPLGHHSEVAWCLWLTKDLGLSLTETNIDRISEIHSSVCALLLLDLFHANKLAKAPKTTYWKAFETSDALHGELWLLAYEAGIRSWGGFSDVHIKADPHFKILCQADVHFYDTTAPVTPVFYVKAAALKAHDVANETEFFDLNDIDDFDDFIQYQDGDGGYEGIVVSDDNAEEDGIGGDISDDPDDNPF